MQARKLIMLAAFVLQAASVAARAAPPAAAPPAATPPLAPIAYPSVAAALKDLQARDGNGTVVVHADGWVIVNEPLASARWSFTPKGHAAYPAVVRRVIQRGPRGAVSVDVATLCEAPKPACDALVTEFKSMNERIVEAVGASGRAGSMRAMPMPQPSQR